MRMLSSNHIIKHISNSIHEDTQFHENSIDLTVDSIHDFSDAGVLDFGGSEFEPATAERINPAKKNEDDDYGWWELKPGSYKVMFNESLSLSDVMVALLALHTHASATGIVSNSRIITGNEQSLHLTKLPGTAMRL